MRSRTEMSYQNPKNSLAAARLVLKFSSIETRGPVLKHFVMLAAVVVSSRFYQPMYSQYTYQNMSFSLSVRSVPSKCLGSL